MLATINPVLSAMYHTVRAGIGAAIAAAAASGLAKGVAAIDAAVVDAVVVDVFAVVDVGVAPRCASGMRIGCDNREFLYMGRETQDNRSWIRGIAAFVQMDW